MKKDSIGDRMKENYENRSKTFLPRRTNVIIRIDGKSFSNYTKKLNKPFDYDLMSDMAETTKYLCENIQGAKFGYTQSDEISILITDYDKLTTSAWFDYNVQKITSISASLATAKFNQLRMARGFDKLAHFDSRVFSIPEKEECINYLIWRQQDASRNSIQMAARSVYSHKECNNKNTSQLQDMLMEKGINWNDYPVGAKRGTAIIKTFYEKEGITRSKWTEDDIPILTKDRDYILKLFP